MAISTIKRTSRIRYFDWLLIVALVIAVVLFIRGAFPLSTADLFHTQFAAYEWHVGTPDKIYTIYESDTANKWLDEWETVAARLGADNVPNLHFYPPFVSAALAPFADVPASWWRNSVFVINVCLLFILAWQTLILCGLPIEVRSYFWVFTVLLLAGATISNFLFGQIHLFLSVLTWAGLLAWRKHQQIWGGVLIGLMATIKLTPLALLVLPALQKWWRACAAGIAAFGTIYLISLLWLGRGIFQTWYIATKSIGSRVWINTMDQSITGWYCRIIMNCPLNSDGFWATNEIHFIRIAVLIIFGGVTLITLWWKRSLLAGDQFPAIAGLAVCGYMLTLPFSWIYYHVLPLPVLVWALYQERSLKNIKISKILLYGATFMYLFKFYRLYGDSTFGRLASGNYTIGLILLWFWLLLRIWRSAESSPVDNAQGLAVIK